MKILFYKNFKFLQAKVNLISCHYLQCNCLCDGTKKVQKILHHLWAVSNLNVYTFWLTKRNNIILSAAIKHNNDNITCCWEPRFSPCWFSQINLEALLLTCFGWFDWIREENRPDVEQVVWHKVVVEQPFHFGWMGIFFSQKTASFSK